MGNCIDMIISWRAGAQYETIPDGDASSSSKKSTSIDYVSKGQSRLNSDDLPEDFRVNYTVGTLIGIGTTSKVFAVTNRSIRQHLACKVIDKRKYRLYMCDIESMSERLAREVEVLRRLQHPHIVKYYDCFSSNAFMFIVTERIDGGELYQYLLNKGALPESWARQYLRGVADALVYIHRLGIIHRDVKAENLMFCTTSSGEKVLKLIDFGFSTILEGKMTGTFLGTGGYLAPEIRRGTPYSTSVDMWSLGVVVYCTVSTCLPFGIDVTELSGSMAESTAQYQLQFPEKQFSGVSEDCRLFIKSLLEVDSSKRLTAEQALRHPWVSVLLALLSVLYRTLSNKDYAVL